jgi:hypothetical protein
MIVLVEINIGGQPNWHHEIQPLLRQPRESAVEPERHCQFLDRRWHFGTHPAIRSAGEVAAGGSGGALVTIGGARKTQSWITRTLADGSDSHHRLRSKVPET